MRHFAYTAVFIAPFGVYANELLLGTARGLRAGLKEQGNAFSALELRVDTEEGTALLRCGGTDGALEVEREIGMHSLHGALRVAMEVRVPERAEAALERAFEQASVEKGVTILERSSRVDAPEK
ncbi:MAG: hypothetical protein AAGU74_13910 [Bacillota bacterium]